MLNATLSPQPGLVQDAALTASGKVDKGSGANGVSYSRVGNAADAVPATGVTGQGGVALMGGGLDVDDAFRWMIDRMAGKDAVPGQSPGEFNGDFLILRASKSEGYNQYVYDFGGVNSVSTLVVPTRSSALDPAIGQIISRAEAIFIAGGDQGDYIERWTGTPVQAALNDRLRAGVPVGGTSAGAMVLSQFIYSAEVNGVTSDVALKDPLSNKVTLARDFVSPGVLPALTGTIVDTHYQVRNRTGRMGAFLARIDKAGWTTAPERPLGIGLNEQTALLVEPSGLARVVGNAGASSPPGVDFLRTPAGATIVCEPKRALTYDHLAVARVTPGGTFQLANWESNWTTPAAFTSYFTVTIRDGVLTTGPAGGGSTATKTAAGSHGPAGTSAANGLSFPTGTGGTSFQATAGMSTGGSDSGPVSLPEMPARKGRLPFGFADTSNSETTGLALL
ncbi:MAG: cyanophycinase [Planctomycetaceae bacterium]